MRLNMEQHGTDVEQVSNAIDSDKQVKVKQEPPEELEPFHTIMLECPAIKEEREEDTRHFKDTKVHLSWEVKPASPSPEEFHADRAHSPGVQDFKTDQTPGPSQLNTVNITGVDPEKDVLPVIEVQGSKTTNTEMRSEIKASTRRRIKKIYSPEELEVQRRKATERKRRERARIRSDPEALEKFRQNERERQRKRKEKGQLKPIKERGLEAQCRQRMLWRINSHNFYRKIQAHNRDS